MNNLASNEHANGPPSEEQLDAIIQQLNQPYNGVLPKQALGAARQCRDAITPRLIALYERTVSQLRAGEPVNAEGAFLAYVLLTEFQAKEAWPAIRESLSLPGDELDILFGDALSETLARTFAVLLDTPDDLDALIVDRNLQREVRAQAVLAYALWLRDRRVTRDVVIARLGQHLRAAMEPEPDVECIEFLLDELLNLFARELIEDIRETYRRDLVPKYSLDLKTFEAELAKGGIDPEECLEDLPPTQIDNTVDELNEWVCYVEPDEWSITESPDVDDDYERAWKSIMPSLPPSLGGFVPDDELPDDEMPEEDFDGEGLVPIPSPSPTTIRNMGTRVGRNDPCPCGSGKKYKKCCQREG